MSVPPVPQTEWAVIGWRETVALPEWGIDAITAKADTGARSSALDVMDIEELPGDRVRFHVALSRRQRDKGSAVEVVAPITRRSRVRSAHGTTQARLFVQTDLRVGPVHKRVELGLVCRRKMICRMLIGRTALAGTFLVDSATRHAATDRPRRRKRRKPAAHPKPDRGAKRTDPKGEMP